ncbi:MAG: BMP family ABC transporter substrate-binding protein [Oscillospiraceae bacterium]|nr:BMP family ABC transporter substrate-binding protein [Oscillospiraceae bacterium]
MKKILALVLALCMVFALAACGQQAAPAPAEQPAEQPAEAPAEQPAEAPAEQPAEEPAPAPASADDIPDEMTSADGKYEIAFVTDVGQLKDKSFNQGTYDGVKLYAAANNKSYKYYQPANGDQATDDDRYDAMKAAADNGAKVIVCAGFMQGNALAKAAAEFTDVMFIFIDGWAFDGLNNIAGIAFKEEQCGYLAGYATVKEGYTKLGFCGGGGGTNPACCRYGYGFVQGAAAAAAEMGVQVEMNYSWLYGASFSASPELQTLANGWYEAGTEAIFACGGSMFASISAAASANDGAVIGVDVDQSFDSDTVITSAMKGLSDSVVWALDKAFNGSFGEIGGVATSLGAAENAVGLPTATWSLTGWTVEEYEAMLQDIISGKIVIDDDYANLAGSDSLTLKVVE